MIAFMIIVGFGVTYTSIIALGSLSGIFSERAGVFNIGINGMMIIGALVYAIFSHYSKNANQGMQFLGYAFAALATASYAMLHALASIKFKANQIISGTAINILAAGIALIVIKIISGKDNITVKLDDIKFGASGWSNQFGVNFIFTIVLFIAGWFLINKTKWGLRVKAVGENPAAADSAGINVHSKQYQALLFSGGVAGIAGAFFAQKIYVFSGNVQGLGFLSLALMIMGQWKTYYSGFGAIIFGLLIGFALYLSTNKDFIPSISQYSQLTKAIPFLLSLGTMILTSKNSSAPKSGGVVYDKSKR